MKRTYRREFKEDACRLVIDKGYEVEHAAKELGMPHATLRLWLNKRGWAGPRQQTQVLSDDPAALQTQVRDLQARLARAEMEKDILKKATAYFANQNP
jgi:transposase